jgi:tRNA-2-methylthio-N6-dimethylallyladenosine synthase
MISGKYYIETYGCQMNEADSELVAGILEQMQYEPCSDPAKADIIIINSCSVREGADARALARLSQFKSLKTQRPEVKLGLIGCVAQRDKGAIIRNRPYLDFVIGPDAYRQLPEVFQNGHQPFIATHLSCTETYEDLPVRRNQGVNAWVPIMRGCNKFCTFCIVPFVRGRERSRSVNSILKEVQSAADEGYKEVTLLGQNVNSYVYQDYHFPQLLAKVAQIDKIKRIRFTSPHPADVTPDMLTVMRDHGNICKHIHLPLQAGSDKILAAMNRNYTQRDYLRLVETIKQILPECALTTDIIVGFPGETKDDFRETVKVMNLVRFDGAFMFQYSPRPNTKASKLPDDVPPEEKQARLAEIIALQKKNTLERNQALIGSIQTVLVEGISKKSPYEMFGRTDGNKITIIKSNSVKVGDLVEVRIEQTAGVSLFGRVVNKE